MNFDEEIKHMDLQLGIEGRCENCGCDIHNGVCPEGCILQNFPTDDELAGLEAAIKREG